MEKNLSPRKDGRQTRSKKTVGDILESAVQLLLQEKITSASTNHIAEKAGVSIGTLYQYFPNKESILKKVAETEARKRREEIAAILEQSRGMTFNHAVDELIEYLLDSFYRRKKLHSFLLKQLYSAQLHTFITEHEDLVQEMLEDFIGHFFKDLDAQERRRSSFMLVHACLGILRSATFFDQRKWKRDEVRDMLKSLIHGWAIFLTHSKAAPL